MKTLLALALLALPLLLDASSEVVLKRVYPASESSPFKTLAYTVRPDGTKGCVEVPTSELTRGNKALPTSR